MRHMNGHGKRGRGWGGYSSRGFTPSFPNSTPINYNQPEITQSGTSATPGVIDKDKGKEVPSTGTPAMPSRGQSPPHNTAKEAPGLWSSQMTNPIQILPRTTGPHQVLCAGEASQWAVNTYQKGHVALMSKGICHLGDYSTLMCIPDVNKLFMEAKKGQRFGPAHLKKHGAILLHTSERGVPLSAAQRYALDRWRRSGLCQTVHQPLPGMPVLAPMRAPTNTHHPDPVTKVREPKLPQPTHADTPKMWTAWLKWYNHPRADVVVDADGNHGVWSMQGALLVAQLQPNHNGSSICQHLQQQVILLLMLPGQYCALTERHNIEITLLSQQGPIQNFGPNSGVIDISHAMAAQGISWSDTDDVCLYTHTLTQHLLSRDDPLPDNVQQALQEHEQLTPPAEASMVAPPPNTVNDLIDLEMGEVPAEPTGGADKPSTIINPGVMDSHIPSV
ncbi:hypothetical protein PAXINDRAFT_152540 [Paxillus involutus ATCC 200175]|nr:hypothetical protein PAXINDRAFT_152540 [Paxillus involutus ATCC 200175]